MQHGHRQRQATGTAAVPVDARREKLARPLAGLRPTFWPNVKWSRGQWLEGSAQMVQRRDLGVRRDARQVAL